MSIKQRIKKWFTIDHVVDLCVDIMLMIWDVITNPVLIVVRIIRHFIGEWLTDCIKGFFRWIAHWIERKRAYRLEHGYGILRTYWLQIILSPFVAILLWLGSMLIYGMTLGYEEIKQEDPNSGIVKLLED
jgi:hypothetical protein